MADTLIDPPPPETLVDLEPAVPPAREPAPAPVPDARPGPGPGRKSRGNLLLAIIAAGLVAILLACGALLFYLLVWRYEPVARRHIPGNANVAIRFEASDILLFGPVRKHLWPLLDEPSSSAPPPSSKPAKTRTERIKDATGVNLAGDLRELIVASVDARSWVAIVGGKIPRGRFVKGMEKVFRDEGATGWSLSGDLLIGPRATIGQADDGTIVIGTDVRVVNAALPATEEYKNMGLPEGKAVAFALTREAWSGAAGTIVASLPRGGVLGKIDRATGSFELGSKPLLQMRIEPSQGTDAAALGSDIETILSDLRLILLLAPDVMGEKEAIAASKIDAKGGVVLVTTPWPYEGLDRGAQSLARLLR